MTSFLLEVAGLFLTLVVLLYLIFGDNALFRLVLYTFIGVAAGYVAVLVIFQVLLPRILILLDSDQLVLFILGIVEIVLGIMLLLKIWPRTSFLGSFPLAILTGVGAAVTVGGAVIGTIFGQIAGTINLFNTQLSSEPLIQLLEGSFILLGTVSTLAYFQFSVRSKTAVNEQENKVSRTRAMEILAVLGQGFIGITLGALFAGVYTAAITALLERIGFIFNFVSGLF